jgi:hypothetical protein
MIRTTAALAALVAALALAGTAQAANVKNGGFEKGSLKGWQKQAIPGDLCGRWSVYSGELRGIGSGAIYPPPPQGSWAALARQPSCPSAQVLSQVVKLKAKQTHKLSFQIAYDNEHTRFFTPKTFDVAGPDNQQVRVDVLKANAPVLSFKSKHILKRVYLTKRNAPTTRSFHKVTANLSRFAGKKVRLRFGVAVNWQPLTVALDDVKIKSKRKR